MSEGMEQEQELENQESLRRKPQAGRVRAEEAEDLPFITQRDFRPTPYEQTSWEIVGELTKERDFVPLEVSILADERTGADPMFEEFAKGFDSEDESFVHGKGARRMATFEDEVPQEIPADKLAELEAEFAVKLEEAKAAGFQEGNDAAEAKIAERYDQLMQRLRGVTDAIYQQWSSLASKLERQAVDLSLQVSKKILHTTVEVKPEYIVSVIREALSQLGAAKPVRIRVSLEDYEFLTIIGLPVELSEQELGVTYVADESVKSGCVVETDFGEVDLVLDRMWAEVKDKIYEGRS